MNRDYVAVFGGLMIYFAGTVLHCPTARADVTPASLFSEHAVLQRDAAVPVWGRAAPGEQVSVAIAGQRAQTTAGTDGKWVVRLAPMPAGGPLTMTITGKNTVTLSDILVGDVWVASGQSNMEYGLALADRAVAEKANDSQMRVFFIPRTASLSPLDSIKADNALNARWILVTPENISKSGGWGGFSAVGYYFGQELRHHTGQPVGVIGCYWGGTSAQAWTSPEALAAQPSLAHYATDVTKMAAHPNFPLPFVWADFIAERAKWDKEVGVEYKPKLMAWQAAAKLAKASNQPEPPRPEPTRPQPPELICPQNPSVLYYGMLSQVIPYAIKGVIWYQGESNDGRAAEYRDLFPAMIADWRSRWAQGDFPFLFVQIAPFKGMHPAIREAQFLTLSRSPNTAMVVTTDVGNPNDIHPTKKQPVGHRLALAAKALAYGEKIEYSGPLFDHAQFADNCAIVSFTHVGGGLVARDGDATGVELKGFTIAGGDGKLVPAMATIDGKTVVVRAPGVDHPKIVRYGWSASPDVNLFNTAGLPASPFRSDPN